MSESRIKIWGLQTDFFSFGDFCQSGDWASTALTSKERERASTGKVLVTFSTILLLCNGLW